MFEYGDTLLEDFDLSGYDTTEYKPYLHYFDANSEFEEEYFGDGYYEPWVSFTSGDSLVHYNKQKNRDAYLTFVITGDGNIRWSSNNSSFSRNIEYRKNGGEWTTLNSTVGGKSGDVYTGGTLIPVVAGDKVEFRGNYGTYLVDNKSVNFEGTSATFKLKGNIMSLISSENFKDLDRLTESYTFSWLFTNCTGLTSIQNLVMPATSLTTYCYSDMFRYCTGLKNLDGVVLPATSLASYCYKDMFEESGLITARITLPAMTLAERCYNAMFLGCTNLTVAPELPATTLATSCYRLMFYYCPSLREAPEILPATALSQNCYYAMFYGCGALKTAPELPASTLVSTCYASMFEGCTGLTYIKCLATDISATDCTNAWVAKGSSGGAIETYGTFVKNASMSGWQIGYSGIPDNWTIQNAS